MRAPEHIRTSVAERYLRCCGAPPPPRFDRHAVVEVVGPAWSPPRRGARAAPRPPRRRAGAPQPQVQLRAVRHRRGQPLRPRRRAGRRGAAGAGLQPALPARPPGLGKTHLLHAIGNYVQRYGAGLRVRYATIEEFTTAFVDAVRRAPHRRFKDDFRSADVVLIDDVQFLAGRTKTREEFFHTFNALLDSGRQLVITSDRSPEELPRLEDRLASASASGLVVELEPPPGRVRRAILAKRARLDGVEVSRRRAGGDRAAVDSSVRALEGALIRVVAYASLKARQPTPALVAMSCTARARTRPPTPAASRSHRRRGAGVRRRARIAAGARPPAPRVATARQVAMYLARELTEHSLPEIGRGIGGRNHTTVLHAVNRVSAAMRTDPAVRTAVDNLHRRSADRVTADVMPQSTAGFPFSKPNPPPLSTYRQPYYSKVR